MWCVQGEEMEDRLRFFAEECESIQGLHVFVDTDSVGARLIMAVCQDLVTRHGLALRMKC